MSETTTATVKCDDYRFRNSTHEVLIGGTWYDAASLRTLVDADQKAVPEFTVRDRRELSGQTQVNIGGTWHYWSDIEVIIGLLSGGTVTVDPATIPDDKTIERTDNDFGPPTFGSPGDEVPEPVENSDYMIVNPDGIAVYEYVGGVMESRAIKPTGPSNVGALIGIAEPADQAESLSLADSLDIGSYHLVRNPISGTYAFCKVIAGSPQTFEKITLSNETAAVAGSGSGGGENIDQTLAIGNETANDLRFIDSGAGIVMLKPGGGFVRMTVADDNSLRTTPI
ncbi:MAG: hypothetical protein AAFX06_29670 [Planctomycetota bacterium]